ncbi:hypothetical protein FVE85_5331 [Porphyridium purpureum]|uniref:Exportin-5 C-terminal domain-containing protein n=1 Tax=Porphyridium purpureum TaxID=35688 RepID=A0A5J4Z2A1_PORPP|nr:hypothetical protein FVE85_5331 [Porphyridium purpureum]|eukprot:POR5711..scf295_1
MSLWQHTAGWVGDAALLAKMELATALHTLYAGEVRSANDYELANQVLLEYKQRCSLQDAIALWYESLPRACSGAYDALGASMLALQVFRDHLTSGSGCSPDGAAQLVLQTIQAFVHEVTVLAQTERVVVASVCLLAEKISDCASVAALRYWTEVWTLCLAPLWESQRSELHDEGLTFCVLASFFNELCLALSGNSRAVPAIVPARRRELIHSTFEVFRSVLFERVLEAISSSSERMSESFRRAGCIACYEAVATLLRIASAPFELVLRNYQTLLRPLWPSTRGVGFGTVFTDLNRAVLRCATELVHCSSSARPTSECDEWLRQMIVFLIGRMDRKTFFVALRRMEAGDESVQDGEELLLMAGLICDMARLHLFRCFLTPQEALRIMDTETLRLVVRLCELMLDFVVIPEVAELALPFWLLFFRQVADDHDEGCPTLSDPTPQHGEWRAYRSKLSEKLALGFLHAGFHALCRAWEEKAHNRGMKLEGASSLDEEDSTWDEILREVRCVSIPNQITHVVTLASRICGAEPFNREATPNRMAALLAGAVFGYFVAFVHVCESEPSSITGISTMQRLCATVNGLMTQGCLACCDLTGQSAWPENECIQKSSVFKAIVTLCSALYPATAVVHGKEKETRCASETVQCPHKYMNDMTSAFLDANTDLVLAAGTEGLRSLISNAKVRETLSAETRVQALASYAWLLKAVPTLVPAVLETVIQSCAHVGTRAEDVRVRNEACKALYKLAQKIPTDLLRPYLESVCATILSMLSGLELSFEEASASFLYDALGLISNAIPDQARRDSFTAGILRPCAIQLKQITELTCKAPSCLSQVLSTTGANDKHLRALLYYVRVVAHILRGLNGGELPSAGPTSETYPLLIAVAESVLVVSREVQKLSLSAGAGCDLMKPSLEEWLGCGMISLEEAGDTPEEQVRYLESTQLLPTFTVSAWRDPAFRAGQLRCRELLNNTLSTLGKILDLGVPEVPVHVLNTMLLAADGTPTWLLAKYFGVVVRHLMSIPNFWELDVECRSRAGQMVRVLEQGLVYSEQHKAGPEQEMDTASKRENVAPKIADIEAALAERSAHNLMQEMALSLSSGVLVGGTSSRAFSSSLTLLLLRDASRIALVNLLCSLIRGKVPKAIKSSSLLLRRILEYANADQTRHEVGTVCAEVNARVQSACSMDADACLNDLRAFSNTLAAVVLPSAFVCLVSENERARDGIHDQMVGLIKSVLTLCSVDVCAGVVSALFPDQLYSVRDARSRAFIESFQALTDSKSRKLLARELALAVRSSDTQH